MITGEGDGGEEEGIIRVAHFSAMKVANNTLIPNKNKYQIKKASDTDLSLNGGINEVNNENENDKISENDTKYESKNNEKIYEIDQQELVPTMKKHSSKIFDPSTQFLTSTYIGEIACCPQVWIENDNYSSNETKLDENLNCLIPGTNTNKRNYTALPRYVEKVLVAESKNKLNSNHEKDHKFDSKNDNSLEIISNRDAKNNYQFNEDDYNYRNSSRK
jgi:hypothetical protein